MVYYWELFHKDLLNFLRLLFLSVVISFYLKCSILETFNLLKTLFLVLMLP